MIVARRGWGRGGREGPAGTPTGRIAHPSRLMLSRRTFRYAGASRFSIYDYETTAREKPLTGLESTDARSVVLTAFGLALWGIDGAHAPTYRCAGVYYNEIYMRIRPRSRSSRDANKARVPRTGAKAALTLYP